MDIRYLKSDDSRMEVSRVYEQSWKYAYKDILPEDYLNNIPQGHWSKVIDSPGWYTLILEENGRIVGTSSFCSSRFPEYADSGEIISMYLLPEYVGLGYGGKLMEKVLNELKKKGFSKVFLWVLEENGRALNFYRKFGFEFSGDFLDDDIGGRNVREIRYAKDVM